MSLREDEDRQKNCPSRSLGLGVAAAAIGVGIGAALYYFMNRRPENPNSAGSTTQDWTCEPEHTLHDMEVSQNSDNSFTTISEHSTTDTSVNNSTDRCQCNCRADQSLSDSDSSVSDSSCSDSDCSDYDASVSSSVSRDSDLTEWDVTNSIEFPSYAATPTRHFLNEYAQSLVSFRTNKRNCNLNKRREESFRKRTWSLEECSICFEVILRDQEVMSLPCTHHFHTKCILPWLQEQQTCPNCRKTVD